MSSMDFVNSFNIPNCLPIFCLIIHVCVHGSVSAVLCLVAIMVALWNHLWFLFSLVPVLCDFHHRTILFHFLLDSGSA